MPRPVPASLVRSALLLVWSGLAVPLALAAQEQAVLDAAGIEAFFDGMIRTQLGERNIAGAAVAVVHGGRVLLAKGYGYANVDQRTPVDPESTLFRIGSVTKLFTYAAVMQLVERGELDLEADIDTYLDFRIPDTYPQPITLVHLFTHTAGFEEDLRNLFTHDPEAMVSLRDWVRENLPARVRPPGTFASYSNYGTALAGYIVERTSGMTWDDYLETRLLGPLGMERTTGRQPLPPRLSPFMSEGYTPRGGGFASQPWEITTGAAPAGAISSTAADMAKFMMAFLAGGRLGDSRIIEERTVRAMHARHFAHDPRLPGYGLGFYEMSSHGERIIGHGGNTGWFHTVLALVPEHDLGLFVSYNTSSAQALTLGPFLHRFLDRYFPDSPPDREASRPATLAPLTGTYRFNRTSYTTFQKVMGLALTMSVGADDGVLVVRSPLGTMRMVEIDSLLFREELGPTLLSFRTDENRRAMHAFLSVAPMMALDRVPWHAVPALHLVILATGLLLFAAILLAAPVGWWRRRRRGDPQPTAVARGRRALVLAAAAHLGFVVWVAILIARDFWGFLTTPMTGFAMALTLPLVGAGAVLAAAAAAIMMWRSGVGTRWLRIRYSIGALVGLLFAWSLYYWNLLGWRL